jgi:hypothetical protein
MPETPLLEYQRRRAEAARDAIRHPEPSPVSPERRYAQARWMVREALTFPDALEAVWPEMKADAQADLVVDFPAQGKWLRDFFEVVTGAMEEMLGWARREGEALGREIPRTEELAAAVTEAKRFRDRALANWPDRGRDFGDAPPEMGTPDVPDGAAYLGPDEFSARLRGG